MVDGTPTDKLIKLDGDIESATYAERDTSFGTDGFVDAPSGGTDGITFLDTGDNTTSFLYIIANEGAGFDVQVKLFKVSATTGAVVGSPINLSDTAFLFGDVTGLTNDGTNLIIQFRDFGEIVKINPATGADAGFTFLCCPNVVFGAKAFARHAARNQYFAAKGNSLLTIDSTLQQTLAEEALSIDGAAFTGDVEGMVFDQDLILS